MTGALEPTTGRYLNLDLDGRAHRLYFEEAGSGIPLVCLHTAGSDTRQYRALFNDPEITQNFRVIAFDMPWHGKSSPPEGWQNEEYRLTTSAYSNMIINFIQTLELESPVVMGCSIGGRVILNLALTHGESLRAVIGLQSSGHVDPYYDTIWLHHSDVHGGEVSAGYVFGLIAPQSPERERWETLWHYMQGGPGVFKGDLNFYMLDGDIRDRLQAIDTNECPVYLLTGEYDYSCTPAHTREAASRITGAKVTVMDELGHFPMSENPRQFRSYLLPVLHEICRDEASQRG
ncbi:MAG: alpha/beta hydrolase [Pseudomonadota bacterium]|nr:alpha/beta hydrolase [Pseudomonadota bacterium]